MNGSRSSETHPEVSVIIPLYNHERYIKESVYSVLEQTVQDFELIIINDGSTDNSEAVVKDIHDHRIRYYAQENRGAHDAINKGIELARGDYISILNSDDIYYRERLEEALRVMKGDTSLDAVFSHIEIIGEEGNFVRIKKGAEDNWLGRYPESSFKESNNLILDLLAGNFLHTSSNLFCRKSVFSKIGHFIHLRYTHDYEFFLRLCYHCNVWIIDKPLLKYRFHSANTLREDFAQSIFETGLVLAKFFMNNDLKRVFPDATNNYETMARFINSINTYDSDRMIVAMLLLGKQGLSEDETLAQLTNPDNIFRKACIEMFKKYHDISTIKQALAWQEGQTELWWRKAEELKTQVVWQKEQTDIWWKESETCKKEIETCKSEIESYTEEIQSYQKGIQSCKREIESCKKEIQSCREEIEEKDRMLNAPLVSYAWKITSGIEPLIKKILPSDKKKE